MIKIKVDDREKNKDLLKTFMSEAGISVSINRMTVGDYQVDNCLLVERKTIIDFCISLKDGRLFRQAAKLTASPIQGVMILEGTSSDFQTLGFKREAVQGALITLSLVYKLPLLRSKGPEETARLIVYASRQLKAHGNRLFRRPFPHNQRFTKKYKKQIHVLQGLPGIGPKRARSLIDQFGSLRAVFNASPVKIEEVLGMGKHTAKKIISLIE